MVVQAENDRRKLLLGNREMTKHWPSKRVSRRRGKLTLEVLLILPILFLTTMAVFQFGIAMTIKQAVTHAATVAAREAGKHADADELVFVVDAILDNHRLGIGENATLILEDPVAVNPQEIRGSFPCCGATR